MAAPRVVQVVAVLLCVTWAQAVVEYIPNIPVEPMLDITRNLKASSKKPCAQIRCRAPALLSIKAFLFMEIVDRTNNMAPKTLASIHYGERVRVLSNDSVFNASGKVFGTEAFIEFSLRAKKGCSSWMFSCTLKYLDANGEDQIASVDKGQVTQPSAPPSLAKVFGLKTDVAQNSKRIKRSLRIQKKTQKSLKALWSKVGKLEKRTKQLTQVMSATQDQLKNYTAQLHTNIGVIDTLTQNVSDIWDVWSRDLKEKLDPLQRLNSTLLSKQLNLSLTTDALNDLKKLTTQLEERARFLEVMNFVDRKVVGRWDGSVYTVSTEKMNFDDAQKHCSAIPSSHLAELNSKTEYEHVRDFIFDLENDVWISISDQDEEGQWRSVAGTDASGAVDPYLQWYPNQPTGGRAQNCVYLYWAMGDDECQSQRPFALCEVSMSP